MQKLKSKKIEKLKEEPINMMVSLYKVKFAYMRPIAKLLEEYQSNKVIRPDTMYAQGFSDGFDLAAQCCIDILNRIEKETYIKQNGSTKNTR